MNVMAIILEVMDKEPSLPGVWVLNLFLAAFGYLLCRRYKRSLLFILPITLLFAYSVLAELHDPYVGPAILREAGRGYLIQNYMATAVAVLVPCAGALMRRPRPEMKLA